MIGTRLAELTRCPGISEIVVVDGGSTDRTRALVGAVSGIRLLVAPRGRGTQLNAGARATHGRVLLFLHADVSLPADAPTWIARALAAPDVVAGAFRVRTLWEGGRSWVRPFLWLADVRSRFARLPYGDQAMFVRREAFEHVGGFPDQPLMEDIELGRRLWSLGRVVTVPAFVRVSGRRFVARPLRTVAALRCFPLFSRLGVSPRVLAHLYGSPR